MNALIAHKIECYSNSHFTFLVFSAKCKFYHLHHVADQLNRKRLTYFLQLIVEYFRNIYNIGYISFEPPANAFGIMPQKDTHFLVLHRLSGLHSQQSLIYLPKVGQQYNYRYYINIQNMEKENDPNYMVATLSTQINLYTMFTYLSHTASVLSNSETGVRDSRLAHDLKDLSVAMNTYAKLAQFTHIPDHLFNMAMVEIEGRIRIERRIEKAAKAEGNKNTAKSPRSQSRIQAK